MTLSLTQLQQKAYGSITALEKMTAAERKQKPTMTFGVNYNRLREQVIESFPHMKDALPSAIPIDTSYGGAIDATYIELLAYYEEINNLLLSSIDRHA
jgi:hypothetical protein